MIKKILAFLLILLISLIMSGCASVIHTSKLLPSNYFETEPININGLSITIINETKIKSQRTDTGESYYNIQFVAVILNKNNYVINYSFSTLIAEDKSGNLYVVEPLGKGFQDKIFYEKSLESGDVSYEYVTLTINLDNKLNKHELTLVDNNVKR